MTDFLTAKEKEIFGPENPDANEALKIIKHLRKALNFGHGRFVYSTSGCFGENKDKTHFISYGLYLQKGRVMRALDGTGNSFYEALCNLLEKIENECANSKNILVVENLMNNDDNSIVRQEFSVAKGKQGLVFKLTSTIRRAVWPVKMEFSPS